jgi:CRP-like cAMP-binding protein
MKSVGNFCQTLSAPVRLSTALVEIGKREHFPSKSALFHAGDRNVGVYLVCSGEVCLEVPAVPQLTRVFSSGSLLGLPSTFSEKPYSLNAVSATDCEIIHVSQQKFLDLMKAQPDLCREATEILTSEIAFIFSALREQPRSVVGEAGTSRSASRIRAKAVNQ